MKKYVLFDHDGVLQAQDFSEARYRIDALIEVKDLVLDDA